MKYSFRIMDEVSARRTRLRQQPCIPRTILPLSERVLQCATTFQKYSSNRHLYILNTETCRAARLTFAPDYGAHACMLPASLPLANYPQAILLTLHSSLPHFPNKIVPDIHSHCWHKTLSHYTDAHLHCSISHGLCTWTMMLSPQSLTRGLRYFLMSFVL